VRESGFQAQQRPKLGLCGWGGGGANVVVVAEGGYSDFEKCWQSPRACSTKNPAVLRSVRPPGPACRSTIEIGILLFDSERKLCPPLGCTPISAAVELILFLTALVMILRQYREAASLVSLGLCVLRWVEKHSRTVPAESTSIKSSEVVTIASDRRIYPPPWMLSAHIGLGS
jgi:hypothetical protein